MASAFFLEKIFLLVRRRSLSLGLSKSASIYMHVKLAWQAGAPKNQSQPNVWMVEQDCQLASALPLLSSLYHHSVIVSQSVSVEATAAAIDQIGLLKEGLD